MSPSFVKDHVHKDGKKIGTTLLAAAITNHPFLEGMRAITLYNFIAMDIRAGGESTHERIGEGRSHQSAVRGVRRLRSVCRQESGQGRPESVLRLLAEKSRRPSRQSGHEGHLGRVGAAWGALSLAEVGQRVMIAPGNAHTRSMEARLDEIAEVVGDGDDAFVSVKDANGFVHKWFRTTELLPASTIPRQPGASVPVAGANARRPGAGGSGAADAAGDAGRQSGASRSGGQSLGGGSGHESASGSGHQR